MTFHHLNDVLLQLIEAHKELLANSKEKTKILVEGQTESLEKALITEQKIIKKIERIEALRIKAAEAYAKEIGLTVDDIRITELLEATEESKQEELEGTIVALVQVMTDLKHQEAMNKELITQSMQFVQLSLSMLNPTLNNLNYGKQTTHRPPQPQTYKRSMFDSEA